MGLRVARGGKDILLAGGTCGLEAQGVLTGGKLHLLALVAVDGEGLRVNRMHYGDAGDFRQVLVVATQLSLRLC